MRRRRIPRSRVNAAIEAGLSFVRSAVRLVFFNGEPPAGEPRPEDRTSGKRREENIRWIKHQVFEPEFYVDVFFIVAMLPWFLRDVMAAKQERSRYRRRLAKSARIRRYRTRASMMSDGNRRL